ncbi:peritrophin-1 [Xylocopa sonorina]|uniref:peritrophin-1 n=1 Tax=Xylocopa sonorina TaxID=1818115 RepID=UPI00403AFBB5
MKGLLVVAFAVISVAFVLASEPKCPPHNSVDVILLPNPDDCGSYYSCNEGKAWLLNCSEGLHFNPELNVCDWPENVNCEVATTVAQEETPATEEILTTEEILVTGQSSESPST